MPSRFEIDLQDEKDGILSIPVLSVLKSCALQPGTVQALASRGRVHELYPVIRLAVHADNRAIRLLHHKQTERGAAECQWSRRGLY